MSNKMWLEKLIKWVPKDDKITILGASNIKRYCKDFEIGDKDICKHYRGYPMIVNRTCSEECGLKINYISAEDFAEQSEKVQRVLLDWWKDNIKTLDFYKTRSILCGAIHVNNEEQIKSIKKFIDETIPLLRMDQLMQFTQEKGYKFVSLNNYIEVDKKQMWTAKAFETMMQFKPSFETFEEDKLQALWKVAIGIAEGDKN